MSYQAPEQVAHGLSFWRALWEARARMSEAADVLCCFCGFLRTYVVLPVWPYHAQKPSPRCWPHIAGELVPMPSEAKKRVTNK